jgi:GntR family transcriptional regulator
MKLYPIDRRGVEPLYVQLSGVIKRNIEEGHLKPGDPLPSESSLMEAYQVSRITVRNALLRLEYDRQLFKVHGRGTFVAAQELMSITSPFESLEKQLKSRGIEIRHRLVEFKEVYPPEQIKEELKLAAGQQATKIKRVIMAGEKSIGLRTLFVPLAIGKKLAREELEQEAVLDLLNRHGHKASRMEVRIHATNMWDVDAEYMGVDEASTALVRRVVIWDYEEQPILAGRVVYLAQYVILRMEVTADQHGSPCTVNELMNIENWE